jgi:hypothetical protein
MKLFCYIVLTLHENRGSSVIVVTGLRSGRPLFDSRQDFFSPLFPDRTSYPVGAQGLFLGSKAAET